MAFEVTCGQCNGRLRVEQPGTVVACPHCGTHLTTADAAGSATVPADNQSGTTPEADLIASTLLSPASANAPSRPVDPSASPDSTAADQPDFSGFGPGSVAPGDGPAGLLEDPFAAGFTPPDLESPANTAAVDVSGPAAIPPEEGGHAWPDPSQQAMTTGATESETPQTTAGPDTSATVTPAVHQGKSKAFTLLKLYAILVTVLATWLFLQTRNNSSELESLPDIEPERGADGKIGFIHTREDAGMPAGHTLRLGEERRFGNLKVTALRVTRGTLDFDHFDVTSNATRPSVPGVLKLWLRFENMSENQEIAPLRSLVFKRHYDMETDRDRANNFVCRVSQKKPDGSLILVYDHVINGDWDIRGMSFQDPIPPGQSIETFIPATAESEGSLFADNEPLVWRFHFRKGYSPKNYGVTTLVEVQFSEEEVVAERGDVPAAENTGTQKQS